MSCPSTSANTIGDFGPDSLYPYDDLGRLGTFDWIEADKAVGGGVDRWNDFDDHRADTVPWIIRHVLNADDPAAAVLSAQADETHRHADVDRIPGPAGPIYEVINGRHRTHAMRILGVPLMVAEVVARPLPCGLATLDEVSAAFAAPAHVNAGDNSSQAKRSCVYLDGPSDTATGAISILVLRVPDLAPDWFANRVASRECAKPVSGLGERAYSCVDPGREAYVETLTGDLIVTVSYHWQGEGTASTDLASYLPRLVLLATAVIERL
jgi:hypothetical protein